MTDKIDRNALSYWFPKIEAADLPVPKTIIVKMPPKVQEIILAGMNGENCDDPLRECDAFFASLGEAATAVGLPFFLRTDHTSGKHEWERTCFVRSLADLPRHVGAVAEYSEMAGMFGELPWSTWAVREMLPTIPLGICPRYGNMPVCREFRFFVDDGVVRCVHPYWPLDALKEGGAARSLDYKELCRLTTIDDVHLHGLAARAGQAVDGSWSVDVLDTSRGWYITDMAVAADSWHWPECELAARPQR